MTVLVGLHAFFFFNDPAPTEIYPLSLPDALPILQTATNSIPNPQSVILRLSGLEPLNITPEFGFAVIGERTNITGSPKFSKLILADDFEGDRKSTRLNSSHLVISYAVFCLK